MGARITFNYTAWIAAFPQFSNIPQSTVETVIVPIASVYCPIDGCSPVCEPLVLNAMLNLMVAHIAQLLFGSTSQPLSPLVGRISSASEGSVSVSVEFPTTTSNAWFNQTQFGAMYYQMTLPYRLSVYFPKITQLYQPLAGGQPFVLTMPGGAPAYDPDPGPGFTR